MPPAGHMGHCSDCSDCSDHSGLSFLTSTEGVDVLVELEPNDSPIVVDDVGLTVPGARDDLLSAISLEANTPPTHHQL